MILVQGDARGRYVQTHVRFTANPIYNCWFSCIMTTRSCAAHLGRTTNEQTNSDSIYTTKTLGFLKRTLTPHSGLYSEKSEDFLKKTLILEPLSIWVWIFISILFWIWALQSFLANFCIFFFYFFCSIFGDIRQNKQSPMDWKCQGSQKTQLNKCVIRQ